MTSPAPSPDPAPARPTPKAALWAIGGVIALCAVIEIGLYLADLGVIDAPRLRRIAYDWGGFWPGLLAGWQPNYFGQAMVMFFTYGFLHGGIWHMAINMITLWSLGLAVIERVGIGRFAAIYLAALWGGALCFGFLAESFRPMVGASGALFGLAGALLIWNYVDRVALKDRLWPVAQMAALLIAINLVMYWALDGQLAWQTHLGGFIAGALMALAVDRPGSQAAASDEAPPE